MPEELFTLTAWERRSVVFLDVSRGCESWCASLSAPRNLDVALAFTSTSVEQGTSAQLETPASRGTCKVGGLEELELP